MDLLHGSVSVCVEFIPAISLSFIPAISLSFELYSVSNDDDFRFTVIGWTAVELFASGGVRGVICSDVTSCGISDS